MTTRSGRRYQPIVSSSTSSSLARSLNRRSAVGTLGALAAAAGQAGFHYFRNAPVEDINRAASMVRRSYRYGRRFIQSLLRQRAGRRMIGAGRNGRMRPGAPSVSRRGTVASSRGATRFVVKRKASYRGRRSFMRKRRRRRAFNGRGNGIMGRIIRLFTTPQITKVTYAFNKASAGNGVRTWAGSNVNTLAEIKDMYDRRPAGKIIGDVTTPGSADATMTTYGQPNKIHVTRLSKNYTLQNRSNWDMHLKVYECLARRDFDMTNEAGAWARATFGSGFSDSANENRDYNQPTYAGAGDNLTAVYENPTYTPYMSSEFCSEFKIIKTTQFKLGPNDYVAYKVSCAPKSFNCSVLTTASNAGGYQDIFRRWSKVLLFTWVGGPSDDNTTGANTKQTKSVADLFIQVDYNAHFWFEPRNLPLYNISSSNADANQVGFDAVNTYSTLATIDGLRVPATEVVETVAATTGADDEVVPHNPT